MAGLYHIQSALSTHLGTAGLGLAIAWENTGFKPNLGTPYLRAALLPGRTQAVELGPGGGINRHQGIFQVTACHPAGEGSGPARSTADRIAGRFQRGAIISTGHVNVRISEAWSGQPTAEPGWFCIPVSISWFAHIPNH